MLWRNSYQVGFRIETSNRFLTNPLDDRARGPLVGIVFFVLFLAVWIGLFLLEIFFWRRSRSLALFAKKGKIGKDVGVWYIPTRHVKFD
jgi:hypothetical protein